MKCETILWIQITGLCQMNSFFSLDQFEDILNVCLEFLTLLNEAIDVVRDLSLSEKERAIKCFDIFAEFKMDKYRVARERLIETFRRTLNVPLLS